MFEKKNFISKTKIYVKPKKEQSLALIATLKSFYIGFQTKLFSNSDTSSFCCKSYDSIELKRKNENKSKCYFFLEKNLILGLSFKKMRNFKMKDLTIECNFESYMFMNEKFNFIKSIFLDLEDQLLRNWSFKPTIQIQFSTHKDKEEFFELISQKINKKTFFKKKNKELLPRIYIKDYYSKLLDRQKQFLEKLKKLPKELAFDVFCLLSNGTLIDPVDIDFNFLDFLIKESYDNKNLKNLEVSMTKIYSNRSYLYSKNLLSRFKKFYYDDKKKAYLNKRNPESFKIKKIFVTPNNVIFHSKEDEYNNRILNNYKDKVDRFLTVTFCNVKFQKQSYCFDNFKSLVQDLISPIMKNGIKICQHQYSFLCYSNSQLRSHSVWMIEEDPSTNFTFDHIFKKMGDFTQEKVVSKNASRRGLLFTTAKYFKEIKNCKEIPDKESSVDEHDYYEKASVGYCVKKYCFTDGIGRISYDLAREAAVLFSMPFASAYQIRFGGYKGVISSFDNMEKNSIELRKSMRKFISPLKELFIIRASSYSKGYLNRQIILLLNSMGIEDQIFIKMQDEDLAELADFVNLEIKNASVFTEINFLHEIFKYIVKDLDKNQDLKKQLKYDPFIHGVTNSICLFMMEDLKNKAKISDSYSGKFIGIIDEYEILKNDEVFLCVNKTNDYDPDCPDESKCEIITGRVIITKNPCMYQNDIQVCQAVSYPQLKKYVNVIVFPKNTLRPIQQLISDGDLDGDIYYVSWNPDFIQNIKKPKLASMDYVQMIMNTKEETAMNNVSEIEKDTIINFFCMYLENDILGTICNRHLAFADNYGVSSDSCLKLATFQSNAVNFGKHGTIVSYDDLKSYRIIQWPDYMEKERIYESKHVIGFMYRHIKKIYREYMETIFSLNLRYKFRYDKLFYGFELFIEISTKLLFDYYYDEVHSIMKKFRINSEFEFLTTKQAHFKNNKFGKNYHDSESFLKMEVDILAKYYQEYFYATVYETYLYLISKYGENKIPNDQIFHLIGPKDIKALIKSITAKFQANEENQKYFDEIKAIFSQENLNLEKIKNCFLSAIYFISYMHYAHQGVLKNINFANFEIFENTINELEKNKYLIYNRYRDYDEESEYFDSDYGDDSMKNEEFGNSSEEMDFEDDEDYYKYQMKKPIEKEKTKYFLKKFKVFYGLIWIVDPKFLLS